MIRPTTTPLPPGQFPIDPLGEHPNFDRGHLPADRFILEHRGDAMVGAFLPPKARLVVDRSRTPANGDIVVAELHGKVTVKFLKQNDHTCWLISANRQYPDVRVYGEPSFRILGVVTTVLIDTNDLRERMI